MGRKKNATPDDLPFMEYNLPPIQTLCPTVNKITTSNEMHLFDLASIQSELECILATISERIMCLSAESKNKELPASLVTSFRQRLAAIDSDGNSNGGCPSLMVKANPDKPLTLIISQKNRAQHVPPPIPAEPPQFERQKFPPSPCLRRNSRSFEESDKRSPVTADKHHSSYAIPNKFWELMEPYCAEITEANISYLEGLIRSYQDLEASYFQLPPLPGDGLEGESLPKRPRRDCAGSSSSPLSYTHTTSALSANLDDNQLQLAKDMEVELQKPIGESSMLGKLSQMLLNSCYQDNLHGVNKTLDALNALETDSNNHKVLDENPESSEFDDPLTIPDLCKSLRLPPLSTSARQRILVGSCQSMRNLAKELHVNASYRVEKKVNQAMADLGLVPLKFIHPQDEPVPGQSSGNPGLFRIKLLRLPTGKDTLPKLSPSTEGSSDNRLNSHSNERSLRSPFSKKAFPELSSSFNSDSGRRRTSSIKPEEPFDSPSTIPNGVAEFPTSQPEQNDSGGKLSRRRKRQQRSTLSISTPNGDDRSEPETDSRLVSPKSTKETQPPMLNGLLTSDEEDGDLLGDELPGERGRTRACTAAKRLRLDDALEDSPKPSDLGAQINGDQMAGEDNGTSGDIKVDPIKHGLAPGDPAHDSGSRDPTGLDDSRVVPSCCDTTDTRHMVPNDLVNDEVCQAIWTRQQELRMVCAENLSVLRRLVQAARRDMQRQEIQRRLAIADADVIEAYNKLESYRPQRKAPLKRDRDTAYKALKERKKILKELELFDSKSP